MLDVASFVPLNIFCQDLSTGSQILQSDSVLVHFGFIINFINSWSTWFSVSFAFFLHCSSCVEKDPQCHWKSAPSIYGDLINMLGGSLLFHRLGSLCFLLALSADLCLSAASLFHCLCSLNIFKTASRHLSSFLSCDLFFSSGNLFSICSVRHFYFKSLASGNVYSQAMSGSLSFFSP